MKGRSMFNFRVFFEKFISMIRRVNKKAVLSSLLVVVATLFCFTLIKGEEFNKFARNYEKVEIGDEIIPTTLSAKEYIKREDIKMTRKKIARSIELVEENKLERKETEKDLRGAGNLGQNEEVGVISDSAYQTLLTIVEAEATNEDLRGKILIANVVLNRVKDSGFPNDIESVVYQKINGRAQFSPIDDGRFYQMTISDSTREAVKLALEGEDYSEGALFFVAKSMTSSGAYAWFDNSLEFLFDYGVHSFYKY